MKQFYLKTMGCQMNDHDSEVISGLLLSFGYDPTDSVDEADSLFVQHMLC